MCEKCVRRLKKLDKKERHLVRVMTNYIINHKYACIPLFMNTDINLAIEEELYLFCRKLTNKKIYNRRLKDEDLSW